MDPENVVEVVAAHEDAATERAEEAGDTAVEIARIEGQAREAEADAAVEIAEAQAGAAVEIAQAQAEGAEEQWRRELTEIRQSMADLAGSVQQLAELVRPTVVAEPIPTPSEPPLEAETVVIAADPETVVVEAPPDESPSPEPQSAEPPRRRRRLLEMF